MRVKVSAVALNPMDWKLSSLPDIAQMFGLVLPSGFGHDFAGTVDEVGEAVSQFSVGDRVFGGAVGRASAEYVVVDPAEGTLLHTPDGLEDHIASTLFVPAGAADAALRVIDLADGETVLIGGAAGGVGVLAVQLARLIGANVIGTASPTTFDFLRELGVEPVAYGPGLADRVRSLAPRGVDAAVSLVGTETIDAALALGVTPERISSIDAGPHPPGGARATVGTEAAPGAIERIAQAVASGTITIPIAATFTLEHIRDAVTVQREGHVHGKVVVKL
ncbi:MAG: hypothetical protein AVDCRST_MAG83-355 [uncultured Arthrobacter sp.]|uniref:Enoyl reductase (ER) domain-containing protein n=1 Tax=uncultured Arthrobacter sp. TaxID=114050 RepID=A0A6J4HA14_9MICC|nr:MAG: hypothetical protein AVDCRST_MAG83-355 [uncultured Arthrobacter sp.]